MKISQEYFRKILIIEAGYQANTADSGNYCNGKLVGTNFGMSAIAIKQYTGRCHTVEETKAFTSEFAWGFYQWYWDFWRVDEINDQSVAELMMNNIMGLPKKAAETAQKAMNRFGYGLAEDGIMGSKTIAAINHAASQNKVACYNAIREEWVNYLEGTQLVFRQGLLNRMALYFPLLLPEDDAAEIKNGGVGYQKQMFLQMLKGALKGNKTDILSIALILLVVPGSIALLAFAASSLRR